MSARVWLSVSVCLVWLIVDGGTTPTPNGSDAPSSSCELRNPSPNRRFCSLDNGCDQSCNFTNEECLVPPGSSLDKVKVVCAPGYSTKATSIGNIAVCLNDKWYPSLPECHNTCGEFKKDFKMFTPTIVDGQRAHLGFFPWHAGLYYPIEKNGKIFWEQKCGGSLISKRLVLTAAHCVKHIDDDVSQLRIALGKYYRSWDVVEPSEQKRNVSAISIPSQYSTATFTFDIALVLLSEGIEFGKYIMPVCLDLNAARTNSFQDNDLYFPGWINTNDGSATDVLLCNTVTAMNDTACRAKIPPFYNTFEKICGVQNNTEPILKRGSSGGGLTTYVDGLHYIIGIGSTKIDNLSLFTSIKWKIHIDWIESEMRRLDTGYVQE